jgi:hypothetical protein
MRMNRLWKFIHFHAWKGLTSPGTKSSRRENIGRWYIRKRVLHMASCSVWWLWRVLAKAAYSREMIKKNISVKLTRTNQHAANMLPTCAHLHCIAKMCTFFVFLNNFADNIGYKQPSTVGLLVWWHFSLPNLPESTTVCHLVKWFRNYFVKFTILHHLVNKPSQKIW